jgi:hypothetical protein
MSASIQNSYNFNGGYKTPEKFIFDDGIKWVKAVCSSSGCNNMGVFPDSGKHEKHFCYLHNPSIENKIKIIGKGITKIIKFEQPRPSYYLTEKKIEEQTALLEHKNRSHACKNGGHLNCTTMTCKCHCHNSGDLIA